MSRNVQDPSPPPPVNDRTKLSSVQRMGKSDHMQRNYQGFSQTRKVIFQRTKTQMKKIQKATIFFFFWGRSFICNCLSYFITARITFTYILYPQCTHMIFIVYTSCNKNQVSDNFFRNSLFTKYALRVSEVIFFVFTN